MAVRLQRIYRPGLQKESRCTRERVYAFRAERQLRFRNAIVRQNLSDERLQEVTTRHGGAIIKTIGDAIMAAFLEPVDAVRAAIAMRDETASFNRSQPNKELILKIGVHKGAAIAVTLNDRLDYFGQTVNLAARVQNLADADEIYISRDVHEAPGVDAALKGFTVDQQVARLRGVHQELHVFRIAPAGHGRAGVLG